MPTVLSRNDALAVELRFDFTVTQMNTIIDRAWSDRKLRFEEGPVFDEDGIQENTDPDFELVYNEDTLEPVGFAVRIERLRELVMVIERALHVRLY